MMELLKVQVGNKVDAEYCETYLEGHVIIYLNVLLSLLW